MDTKLFYLHKSIALNAPITLSIRSAHFTQAKLNCVLFEWVNTNLKGRFHLLNEWFEPMVDDTLIPQVITLNIKDIKSVEINTNFTYNYAESIKSISHVALEKALKDFPWLEQGNRLKYSQSKQVYHETINASEVMIDHTKHLYESIYVLDDELFTPLVYTKMSYDIMSKKIVKKGFYLHESIDKYINNPGIEIIDETMFLRLVKKEVPLIKKEITFHIEYKLKTALDKKIKTFLKGPMHRPIRAYYGQISKKNLGRKDYVLNFQNHDLALRDNQESLSSMKHPLTYIKKKHFNAINHFVSTLIHNTLLNGLSLVIIDQSGNLDNPVPFHALDLRNANVKLPIKDACNESLLTLNPYDFERYFEALEAINDKTLLTNEADYYTRYYQVNELFHESIVADSYYEILLNEGLVCDISALYGYTYDKQDLLNYLAYKAFKMHEKRYLNQYKKVRLLLENNQSKDLFKAIKDPFILHHLKQLYPVFFINDTLDLPKNNHLFDMALILYPKEKHLLDFNIAHKVTLIDDELYNHEVVSTIPRQSEGLIKTYFDSTIQSLIIHDIDSTHDAHDHVSTKEVFAIKDFIAHQVQSFDIRTFFNAQKDLIKEQLGIKAKTLYEPLTPAPSIVSVGLNKDSTKTNYDWIKEHPVMIDHLFNPSPYQRHLFLDLKLVTHFNTEDRFSKLINLSQKPCLNATCFDDLLLDEGITYYEEFVLLSKIIKGYQDISVQSARYLFYDDYYHLKMVLCLLPAFYSHDLIDRLTLKFKKESISLYFISTSDLSIYQRKLHILKTIGKIKPL